MTLSKHVQTKTSFSDFKNFILDILSCIFSFFFHLLKLNTTPEYMSQGRLLLSVVTVNPSKVGCNVSGCSCASFHGVLNVCDCAHGRMYHSHIPPVRESAGNSAKAPLLSRCQNAPIATTASVAADTAQVHGKLFGTTTCHSCREATSGRYCHNCGASQKFNLESRLSKHRVPL